ncbi:hypothetical protein E2C01_064789 [Portunus trituberculatus]|uniref:Uncharacterized protein n=1 Tax=Portunus trituberculatus TaxID=210409 RepID=A0A5B7HPC3_PORTR|nr:hypothetical protein [Portunus trituberculatus]
MKALIGVYQQPDHHQLKELQSITLGDMWPSVLWQQMQLINVCCNTPLPKAVLRSMFLQKLPWEVRVTLSSLEESTSDLVFISAADCVVSQLSSRSQASTLVSFPVPASVNQALPSSSGGLHTAKELFHTCMTEVPSPDLHLQASLVIGNIVENQASAEGLAMATTSDAQYCQVLQCLEAIKEQLRAPLPHQGRISYNRFSASPPSSVGSSNEGLCWYHATFGFSARQCCPPCWWSGNDYRGGR